MSAASHPPSDPHFAHKVALVTGAASGIGRGLALELGRRGSRVILADLQAGKLAAVLAELRQAGGAARSEVVDVTDFAAVDAMVDRVFQQEGRLDFLFNNAGIAVGGGAHHYSIDDWRRVVNVNLMGVIHGVQAGYRRMIAQGSGHIVNTASAVGLMPSGRAVGYSATKHAIVGLSTSLREQAAMHGVKVTVLCPGMVHTDLLTGKSPYGRELVPIPEADLDKLVRILRPTPPDVFARQALRAVRRNQAVFLPGALLHVLWWIYRVAPGWSRKLDHALLQVSPVAHTLR